MSWPKEVQSLSKISSTLNTTYSFITDWLRTLWYACDMSSLCSRYTTSRMSTPFVRSWRCSGESGRQRTTEKTAIMNRSGSSVTWWMNVSTHTR